MINPSCPPLPGPCHPGHCHPGHCHPGHCHPGHCHDRLVTGFPGLADDLQSLLATIEDWLLHAHDHTREDLGSFLTDDLGWPGSPERVAATLTDRLGELAMALFTARRHPTITPTLTSTATRSTR